MENIDLTKVIPEMISLERVDVLKAQFESDFETLIIDSDELGYSLDYKSVENFDANEIRSELEVTVVKYKEGTEIVLAKAIFTLSFLYKIENLSQLSVQNGLERQVDGGLVATLAGISYSTARGVLLTRFQGTAFKDFILPIVNPREMTEN
jgi:hypothetical protein